MNEEFIKDFSKILAVPDEMLTSEFDLTSLDAWDSIAHISTIALVDQYFKITLSTASINKIYRLKDLFLEIEKATEEC